MHIITKGLAGAALLAIAVSMTACEVPEDGGDEPTKAEAKDATKVNAAKILKEFEGNEAAADAKYDGKTLQVSGVVDKVDTELFDDEDYVIQLSDGSEWAMWTVNCDDQDADAVKALKVGQKLTVLGKFEDGGDLGIEMKGCRVL